MWRVFPVGGSEEGTLGPPEVVNPPRYAGRSTFAIGHWKLWSSPSAMVIVVVRLVPRGRDEPQILPATALGEARSACSIGLPASTDGQCSWIRPMWGDAPFSESTERGAHPDEARSRLRAEHEPVRSAGCACLGPKRASSPTTAHTSAPGIQSFLEEVVLLGPPRPTGGCAGGPPACSTCARSASVWLGSEEQLVTGLAIVLALVRKKASLHSVLLRCVFLRCKKSARLDAVRAGWGIPWIPFALECSGA